MVCAVDFDGTLAVTRFPEIIGPNKKIVDYVKIAKAQGHKIILWTSRTGEDLEAAVTSIIIAIGAVGLLCVVGVAILGFIKIRQAWAELLKEQGHRDR